MTTQKEGAVLADSPNYENDHLIALDDYNISETIFGHARDLQPHHLAVLKNSAIDPRVIAAEGYFSISSVSLFEELGFKRTQWQGPGFIIPIYPPQSKDKPSHYRYRPDNPAEGRGKYQSPVGQANRLDVPRICHDRLGDPSIPLYITEGEKKADALASHGLTSVAVTGIYNWLGRNKHGGKMPSADFEHIAWNDRMVVVAYDNDVLPRHHTRQAVYRLTEVLKGLGAKVRWLALPPSDTKMGVDDFFVQGGTVTELTSYVIEPYDKPEKLKFAANDPNIANASRELWFYLMDRGLPYYSSDGVLHYITKGADERIRLKPANPRDVRFDLSEYVDFGVFKTDRQGTRTWISHFPNRELTEVMSLKAESFHHIIPEIRGVITSPTYRSDGSLILENGYDPDSRLYADFDVEYEPNFDPTEAEAKEALTYILDEMYGDFPFADESSKAHILALLIQPFVRSMIGKTPIYMVEASMQGSGKTKIADVTQSVYNGVGVSWAAAPKSAEEWSKLITTKISEKASVFGIDNLTDALESDALAGAVTSGRSEGRRLGTNEMIEGEITWTWLFTSNNPSYNADTARRTVSIRLQPDIENPSLRTDFKHPQLELWVYQNRKVLVEKTLTIIQYWVNLGKPAGSVADGTFTEWASVMSGILEAVGVRGLMGNRQNIYDPEREGIRMLLAAVAQAFGPNGVRSNQILDVADARQIELPISGNTPQARRTSLGRLLRRIEDAPYNIGHLATPNGESTQVALKQGKTGATKSALWQVVTLSGPSVAEISRYYHEQQRREAEEAPVMGISPLNGQDDRPANISKFARDIATN